MKHFWLYKSSIIPKNELILMHDSWNNKPNRQIYITKDQKLKTQWIRILTPIIMGRNNGFHKIATYDKSKCSRLP